MANNGNSNLHQSRAQVQNEFYTQLSTIEDELRYYKEYFKDKVVFCNCDDPAIGEDGKDHYGDGLGGYTSEFYRFFKIYFDRFGLKKLITTHYDPNKPTYKVELYGANQEPIVTKLEQNGDFRSPECVALLDEADIVVTNPPFSLVKEYIPMMAKSGKKFLILANINHMTFKEIFHYFFEKKMWLGYNTGHYWFKVPPYYEEKKTDFKIDENGQKWRRLGNICWVTNMEVSKRHEPLDLYQRYTEEKYPSYDNFDAIHIKKVSDIPMDYDGLMAVPITYLAYHCEEQFEILGKVDGGTPDNPLDLAKPILNGKSEYKRIVIRKRKSFHED